MNIVTKLAFRSVKSHRVRSAILCVAVLLTSVLYMTVMSICFNIFGGVQLMMMLATGSDYHVMINADGFSVSPAELLAHIESDNAVSSAAILSSTGSFTSDAMKITPMRDVVYQVSSAKALPHLFTELTEGHFPQNETEIALNTIFFPDTAVGDSVTLTFTELFESGTTGAVTPIANDVIYTVTALYQSEADIGAQCPALTLYTTSEENDPWSVSIYASFYSPFHAADKLSGLTERLGALDLISDGVTIHSNVNYAYLTADSSMFSPANIALVVLSVAIVFFCAFLLIYNIYSIALTQDMHTFGLLGVIGTTYRQLRAIIRRQTLLLYLISLPVGLTAGYFIGWRLLSPLFMSMSGKTLNYRFSLWIPVLTALLTLVTILYSAERPLKRIRKLSPLEAVNDTEKYTAKRGRKAVEARRIHSVALAWSSVLRNPGRLLVTSLSITLSIMVFILIASVAMVFKEGIVNSTFDMILSPTYTLSGSTSEMAQTYTLTGKVGDETQTIGETLLASLRDLASAGDVSALRFVTAEIHVGKRAMEETRQFFDRYPDITEYLDYDAEAENAAANGHGKAIFVSVPDELCKYIKISDDEYYTGDELLNGTHTIAVINSEFSISTENGWETIAFPQLCADGETVTSDSLSHAFTVISTAVTGTGVLREIGGYISWDYFTQLFILPESVFNKEFGTDAPIFRILCNYKEDSSISADTQGLNAQEKAFRAEVDALTNAYVSTTSNDSNDNDIIYGIRISGRFDDLEDLENRLNAIQIIGYSLAGIMLLIGIMNMINSALSSILLRQREYAMLEAVGMTSTQLRIMILSEGLISGIIAAVLSLLIGVPTVQAFVTASFEYEFTVDIRSAVFMLLLILAVAATTSLLIYRQLRRTPVTERLSME